MAIRRVQKEYSDLLTNPEPGISAGPRLGHDLFPYWDGYINHFNGAENSPYKGGIFKLSIVFPGDYPFKPPKVQFVTKVLHCNVNSNGHVNLDILGCSRWSPALTIKEVFPLWDGYINGPENSPYEGGIFKLSIVFPEDYPFRPPKVQFVTKVLHCNIDREGRVSLDILGNIGWATALTIKKVFPLWDGYINGPENSPYEGGIFKLSIVFPEDYPFRPPKVQFVTKVLHCNIDREGRVSLDILGNIGWATALTIKKVFPLWDGYINGPENSPYEGGIFKLSIVFPEDYPFRPPKVQFVTKVLHCNIDREGRVSLDILGNIGWATALTIKKVLSAIRCLLGYPNPDDPVVPELGSLLKKNPDEYYRQVREATLKYATPQSDSDSDEDS